MNAGCVTACPCRVNVRYSVYLKSGRQLTDANARSYIWAGSGTICTTSASSAVVVYDRR
jgi:hypothetical protein